MASAGVNHASNSASCSLAITITRAPVHGSPRPLGRIVEKDDAAAVGSHSRALIKFGEISLFRTAFCYLPLQDSELSLIGGIHQRKLRLLTIVGQCGRERLLRDIQLVLQISAVEFE